MKRHFWIGLGMAALAFAPAASGIVVTPDGNAQEKLIEALILAEPGSTIELTEGVYKLDRGISLDVDNVTIKGAGIDKSILSFKEQNQGAEGLTVTSDGVTLRDFAVEDTQGDAIKVKGAHGITFLNVRTEWTGGPKETNGAYGLYPVESENVLIDGCVAIGASDAGLYVGQCKNVVVRNSRAEYNVAGIEIENCYFADVYDNVATHNTGGILVFDLPNLPQQGGHTVRVFNNKVVDNDTLNFAPEGNIVGNVPTGTGIMIMANRNVEVFGNEISGNDTANIMVTAYTGGEGEAKDPNYYPYPEGIHIHSNTFGVGGRAPEGVYGTLMAGVAGSPLPDIVWDGRINRSKLRKDGTLPPEARLYIHSNTHAVPEDLRFVNLDMDAQATDPAHAQVSRDISAHEGKLPTLDAVRIAQDK